MVRKFLFFIFALFAVSANAQNARSVLDATARKLTSGGTYANFTAVSNGRNIWGNISIKGNKFKLTSANAITWYDGKTQWTYMKSTNEVSVMHPGASDQQAINPYNFITLYKKGYSAKMTTKGNAYVVTLTKGGKSGITDAVIEINKSTKYPQNIKVKTDGQWTSFKIYNVKKVNYNDAHFRFNRNQYKDAELIDLR